MQPFRGGDFEGPIEARSLGALPLCNMALIFSIKMIILTTDEYLIFSFRSWE